jgi:phenylpropionate dioxygenase-like ring-hydroxylating dioxygenase large terminal subunit
VVVRDEQCELRAYSNVCRHRMSLLMNGQGNCRRMICPYHGWTYDLQGGLAGAPRMDRSPAFDKRDYRLPEIRLEIWQGWIYLTLNPNARPMADRLSTLHDKIQAYGMADYVETFREEHLWNTNWKILAENFMESYHLPVLHRSTVGSHSSLDDMECPPGEPAYNYHWIKKEASLAIGNAHPDNKRLQGHWRQTTALIAIYPSHLITLTPGYFWYLSLQPREVGKVHITFGGGLAPEFIQDPEGQQAIGQLKTLLDEVNREDRRGVEAVFKGTQAIHAKPGHLCHLERPNYDFAGYLSRCLQGH